MYSVILKYTTMITGVKLMTGNCNYGHPKMADMKLDKNLFCRLNCFYNVF